MLKRVVAGACAFVVVGCSQGSPATSTAVPTPGTVPVGQIDALIIPVDQVPGGLHDSSAPSQNSPDPACPLPTLAQPSASRSARYSGPGNLFITQEIAIYPDAASASAALKPVIDGLGACAGKPGAPTIDHSAATGAAWHAQGFSPVSGETSTTYAADERVVNNVVLKVTAGLFDNPQQVSTSVADKITAKITAP